MSTSIPRNSGTVLRQIADTFTESVPPRTQDILNVRAAAKRHAPHATTLIPQYLVRNVETRLPEETKRNCESASGSLGSRTAPNATRLSRSGMAATT
ncbi:hypothetical protein GCG54_00000444 [Colletotrichum gloeosporioides]|uniref:Uncharacterized protein n=1 Tax=Colletotrichum gloeosporioides TaxID=474922 RepID=A0A8H4CUN6_COLGL|nr:uncharacterized protein GCG54_00000444 [Colletotrichum gloeosporioides]KAF3810398.1 hypothetical protein GCG54_00000444 [Colletotrichum gloeosporioides]